MTGSHKTIHILYYALLREERGLSKETLETSVATVQELYEKLKKEYAFKLGTDILKVAVNNQFVDWQTKLNSGDTVVFIPPVAGG